MSDMNRTVPVLDHGFVELDGVFGSDLTIVNAARASFDKQVEEMTEADRGLIGYLMREKHASPFEHVVFRFRIKAPLFVNREWFRHRIGSFNEESGRYSKLKPEFYVPRGRVRSQVGKPGAYTFEPASREADEHVCWRLESLYREAWDLYDELVAGGVAKEVARLALPVSIYSTFVWTVNLRSLLNFLSLRAAPQAQAEIREYAQVVEGFLAVALPTTYAAWLQSGRKAV